MNNVLIMLFALAIAYILVNTNESFVVHILSPSSGSYTGALDDSQITGHHHSAKTYGTSGFHYYDDYYRDYPEYYKRYLVNDDWFPRMFW